ncbi:hypothetical protein NE237_012046 [Protea cynaroides]|uniref:Uncharacterized protein n=1 Tax=Protea cynaroides TaxID=273540 RepID=A0A9Q0JYV6_9MAGN|nr:hypothetical protein NE237_012046 [Protea cynaroides]
MVDDSCMPTVRLLSGSSRAETMVAAKLASTTHRSLGWRLYDQAVISSAEGGSRMTTGPCRQSMARVSTGGMQLGSRVSMAVDLEVMNFWFVLGVSVFTMKLHVRSTDEREAPQHGTGSPAYSQRRCRCLVMVVEGCAGLSQDAFERSCRCVQVQEFWLHIATLSHVNGAAGMEQISHGQIPSTLVVLMRLVMSQVPPEGNFNHQGQGTSLGSGCMLQSVEVIPSLARNHGMDLCPFLEFLNEEHMAGVPIGGCNGIATMQSFQNGTSQMIVGMVMDASISNSDRVDGTFSESDGTKLGMLSSGLASLSTRVGQVVAN